MQGYRPPKIATNLHLEAAQLCVPAVLLRLEVEGQPTLIAVDRAGHEQGQAILDCLQLPRAAAYASLTVDNTSSAVSL